MSSHQTTSLYNKHLYPAIDSVIGHTTEQSGVYDDCLKDNLEMIPAICLDLQQSRD